MYALLEKRFHDVEETKQRNTTIKDEDIFQSLYSSSIPMSTNQTRVIPYTLEGSSHRLHTLVLDEQSQINRNNR